MTTAMERDLRTLITFVEIYCRKNHQSCNRAAFALKTHDVSALAGHPVILCDYCRKLLTHALVKRTHCPMNPKPQCKHCPVHCYHPVYREQIRQVMKFSGRHLVLRGRLDYLLHLLF